MVARPDPGTVELDGPIATWLTSADGLAAVAAATAAFDAGRDTLSIGAALRGEGLDAPRATAVTRAAEARRRARRRWVDADRLLFTPTALAQASDPAVSAWRAARFRDAVEVEDRACGIGGDTLAIAAVGPPVVAIDQDPARLVLLRHNAAVRGLAVRTVVADALRHPPPAHGPVHADPGRRVAGRRVRRLAEHRPSVPALLTSLADVATAAGVAVVLSPGVDLDDADLPRDAELEFVQLGGQLVEAVAWTGALRRPGAHATATLLDPLGAAEPLTWSRAGRGPQLPVGEVGDHLLEVAPAAVRARLHDEVGARIGARRLATRRALLTVDGDVAPSPWVTARPVETVLPARAAAVRRWLTDADDLPLELVRHGVDVDLDGFRRGIGPHRRGPSGRRLELVRLDRGAVAIVTRATDGT